MSDEQLICRLRETAGYESQPGDDPDSLIGLFQAFRPDGREIEGLFGALAAGDQLEQRLGQLFDVAGDDRRPSGGRDVYFVVRNPPALSPDRAESHARDWLAGLRSLAEHLGEQVTAEALQPLPTIRVLEGIPPKHPKAENEKANLLKSLEMATRLSERIDAGPQALSLRPAFYFTACDPMLRDYLMWPMYAPITGLTDPFEPYFQLWRHGVKYRIFQETQIDLYLPRQVSTN